MGAFYSTNFSSMIHLNISNSHEIKMTVSPQGMSVQALYRNYRDGTLIVNRQYQRKLVWTVAEKQRLIDSILNDYPLPLFLFAEKPANTQGKGYLEVIDGMQRLNAIFSFIEHGFMWEEKCFDIAEFARARQAADAGAFEPFAENIPRITAKQCANMLDYQLAVTVFPGEQDERITDVFGRINSGGKQLSDQERRQAGVLSPFADSVRKLAAEIRGDVSRETLLLSEMPEISIETTRNSHGYALKAEEIFWCYQGVLRTGDLRDSEDEQMIADICASILLETPVEASREYLNKLYTKGTSEFNDINARIVAFGRDRLTEEVKTVFSTIRTAIESFNAERFSFRKLVYSTPTSNSQKTPFYAVFMAFYNLIYLENLAPPPDGQFLSSLKNLADRIKVGQKHIRSEDRLDNIKITSGLIRDKFTACDKQSLSHGPGMIFDFENSIRRSKTETSRYEFKQGLLRLDKNRKIDPTILQTITETICGVANIGPDAHGFVYLGIADKAADAARIKKLDGVNALNVASISDVQIVGIDREIKVLQTTLDKYMRLITDSIQASQLSEPLKTQVLQNIDVIDYKGRTVVRMVVPKQQSVSFIGDDCFIRIASSTHKAKGPQIASTTASFSLAR